MARDDDVTGVLLVGGASRRFGSPKALASFRGTTLAEHGYGLLSAAFPRVIAVGKEDDALPLPFPVLDDGSDVRAAMAGVVAGLRLSVTDLAVVLPTDTPLVTAEWLRELAAAADGVDAAVPQTGPLPGAYRRSALPTLETSFAAGDLALHRTLARLSTRTVPVDGTLLRNANTPEELRALG